MAVFLQTSEKALQGLTVSKPEEGRDVMILEDRSVVVEDGQLRAGVDVEVVCRARVVEVVDHGRDQRSEDLQIRNPVLEERDTLL